MTTEVTVPSRTQAGVEYRVTVGLNGVLVCGCAGFEFRGACWHAEAARGKAMTTQALQVMKVELPKTILPTRDELSVIADIARSVIGARGHAVPQSIDSPAKALAVMLAGHELGVKPMSALRHITVIGGRTEPDAQLCAGIVVAREPDASFEIIELTAEKCTMRLSRPSRNVRIEYTYEIKDAERAGLVKPGSNWQKFPKDMLRAAATKRLCRLAAPDLINAVGAVEVAPVSGLLDQAAPLPSNLIDLDALPARDLYNDGDVVIDPETGEVLEEGVGEQDAPAVDEEEPSEVVGMVLEGGALSRDVWQYVSELLQGTCARHFEGDWEAVYAAFGGHPEAAPFFGRTRSGRPFINPMGRTDAEAHELAAVVQGWLRSQQEAPDEKAPRPPRARAEKDERLGGFANVGAFLNWCQRELGLNGLRVREIAGLPEAAPPAALLDYEGGLDVLRVACAAEAAGVKQAEDE